MAAEKHSSTRRRVLGAAVALPVLALTGFPTCAKGAVPERGLSPAPKSAQALWNRRLTRYRRLHACWKSDAEAGAYRAANDAYEREKGVMEASFGSWTAALASQKARPSLRAAYERVSAAEDVYYHRYTAPMLQAMTRLVQTPVPDLPGLLTKLEIIREQEPEIFDDPPLHSFEMLRQDVERLTAALRVAEC